jgi:1-deoxy-D-xylulose-5-phosphate synthase
VAILAFGSMLASALEAGEQLNATVANMRFVKPIDSELVFRLATTHEVIVTVEEGVIAGGAGSAVAEALAADGIAVPMVMLGLPDKFVEHGDPQQLLAECGLDAAGIVRAVRERLDNAGRRPGKAA